MAHTKSAVVPAKSSKICDYVAPRFCERAALESIISTICAPRSGRNCRRSVWGERHFTHRENRYFLERRDINRSALFRANAYIEFVTTFRKFVHIHQILRTPSFRVARAHSKFILSQLVIVGY